MSIRSLRLRWGQQFERLGQHGPLCAHAAMALKWVVDCEDDRVRLRGHGDSGGISNRRRRRRFARERRPSSAIASASVTPDRDVAEARLFGNDGFFNLVRLLGSAALRTFAPFGVTSTTSSCESEFFFADIYTAQW